MTPTQAGPGTIAEALICGLPIILNDYIPGQVHFTFLAWLLKLFGHINNPLTNSCELCNYQRKKAMCRMLWTMGLEFSLEVLKKQRKLWLVGSAARKTNYIKCQRMLLSWRSLRQCSTLLRIYIIYLNSSKNVFNFIMIIPTDYFYFSLHIPLISWIVMLVYCLVHCHSLIIFCNIYICIVIL